MTSTDAEGSTESTPIPSSVIERLNPVIRSVFSQGDFHRVDMRSIAREAGMSFGTIYRYFTDKEKLLFWFIAYWLRELQARAIEALDGEGSALERIHRYMLAHFRFYEANPDVGRIIFMTVPLERWMRDPSYSYREPIKHLRDAVRQGQKTGEIRSDVKVETILDLFVGIFNRTFMTWEYRGRSYPLTDQYQAILPLIEAGVQGSGSPAPTAPAKATKATKATAARKAPAKAPAAPRSPRKPAA
jgi:AcrR family transcriptional regulator